ncbi:DnaB-like helicase N-terminal domain-containing protein [Streptomyces sp. NPDC053560]|uniref:DnaB-like helicase N-terminal domain-containing protein n=1 Tax=Streptomyces sp. NPDC053560 TaxID=3365711 RepID=UPI0037D1A9D6
MTTLTRRAEEALLGAVLHRPELLPSLRRWLPAAAFGGPDLEALWQALQSIDWSAVSRSEIPAAVTAAVARIEEEGIRRSLPPSRIAQFAHACPDTRTAPLYGGMVLDAAVHRTVAEAGQELRHTARTADVDRAGEVLAGAERTGQRLTGLATAWAAAPETVRNLLETTAEEPLALAERTERARTDPRAEAETVASLLYQSEQLAEVGWLRPSDFSDPQLAAVYRAMGTLAERRALIDPLTVAWEAHRQPGATPSDQVMDELDRGGVPGAAAFTGERVLGTAALDRMDAAGHRMRNAGRHPGLSPTPLLDHADQALRPVAADRERITHAERGLEPAPADAEPAPAGPAYADEEIDL